MANAALLSGCTGGASPPVPGGSTGSGIGSSVGGGPVSTVADSGGTNIGGSLLDPQEFAALPQGLDPMVVQSDTPPVVPSGNHVLSSLPPLYDQRPTSSCEAHSFGYGLCTFTFGRNPDGSIKSSANLDDRTQQVSQMWLYKWNIATLKMQTCTPSLGSQNTPYLWRMTTLGAPSNKQVPWQASCQAIDAVDLSTVWPGMTDRNIGSYKALPKISPASRSSVLPLMKSYIANHHAIAFSGLCGTTYGQRPVPLTNGVYVSNTPDTVGHGQLIVGYNDLIGPANDPGAFLVQNSWGTAWPDKVNGNGGGRIWMSYTTWFFLAAYAAVAFPVEAAPAGATALTSSKPNAPQGVISRLYTATSNGQSQLVAHLHFTAGLTLLDLSFKDPAGKAFPAQTYGGTKAPNWSINYAAGFRSGYVTYNLSQTLPPGVYSLTFNAQLADGVTSVTYTASFAL